VVKKLNYKKTNIIYTLLKRVNGKVLMKKNKHPLYTTNNHCGVEFGVG